MDSNYVKKFYIYSKIQRAVQFWIKKRLLIVIECQLILLEVKVYQTAFLHFAE